MIATAPPRPGQRARRAVVFGLLAAVALAASPLHAHGPTRQKVVETVTIDAPPDAVWKLVGDFAHADAWLPMVEVSTGEGGNEPGAMRTLVLKGGGEVHEELRKYDADKRSLSYRIPVATHDVAVLPVNNYSSTITVAAAGAGSEVTWKAGFYRGYPNGDPPPELNDEAAVKAVQGLYRAGLDHLKEVAESR